MEVFNNLVEKIFGSNFSAQVNLSNKDSSSKDNTEVQQLIHSIEQEIGRLFGNKNIVNNVNDNREGRLGPKLVRLDASTHHGLFILSSDKLSINSQSNFSTMRANTGVYQGKWMYEVQLVSKGVMQLGWSTAQCKFNQESGVGDVVNSYAYDGNRVRKWNVSICQYGEAWVAGDIIGCTIDMEEGKISFYRNGKDLGVAFENISMGPGIVYFPTVSLAFTETLTANFGTTPLRYPVDGYEMLQKAPTDQLQESQNLFKWFEKLLYEYKNVDFLNIYYSEKKYVMSTRGFMACLARCILRQIGPLIGIPYITHDVFLPFIKKLVNVEVTMLFTCLDLMWTFLEIHEIKLCLETTVSYLSSVFCQVSLALEFSEQRGILILLNCLCQHTRTRQYLLKFILFDKVSFSHFIQIKPLDDKCLNTVVNKIWWETDPIDLAVENNKLQYFNACDKIKFWISELEALQVELLTILLNNTDDNTTTPTSRTIFLKKFRRFVQENVVANRIPLPISLCCFHRLLVVFRVLWDAEIGTTPIFIPCRSFCDSSINYTGIDRLGGVLSHLEKTYRNELLELLGTEHENTTNQENATITENYGGAVADSAVFSVFTRMINMSSGGGSTLLERIGYFPYNREDRAPMPLGPLDSKTSLTELLDGIILFYHAAAKTQIAKVANMRDVMSDYIVAMSDTKSRLQLIQSFKNPEFQNVQIQLVKTIEIFNKKLSEQARHMAWVRAVLFSDEKQQRLAWLLKIVLLTLKKTSEHGNLFSFVPEFYLEVLADIMTGLKNHIHPTVPIEKIPGFEEMLQDVAQFLCDHFLDPRIVKANSKDTLILTLAGFASSPTTLDALESVSKDSRNKMVLNLFKSYENRAWAQSNWILERFWQGHGFAFRYDKSPHVAKKFGPKILNQNSISQSIKPCPSLVYQAHIKEVLINNNQAATLFLNSLLNQLNWAFSEFIGMMQEIHNASSRPERVFIESRQLKICATCFDLAVSLLRVLEMIAFIAPKVFSDFDLLSSKNLLERLCQLLCQILNRISMPTSSFQHVVLLDISDLQTVDHFPILTAVIGIIIALLKNDMLLPESEEIPKTTEVLISEPSFQISSLYFVLGDVKNDKIKNVKPFSLLNYEADVSEEEIETVKRMIHHLEYYRPKLPLTDTQFSDDDLCTICYAYPISAIFKPCNHNSCHACIDRHLLNNRNCFFCKATIKQVIDIDGKTLFEFSSDSSITDSLDSGD